MLTGRDLQVNFVWLVLKSKHSLGAQPAVSPLGHATYASQLGSSPMNWISGFQPLFFIFLPWQWVSTKTKFMLSNKKGYSVWSTDVDLKPTAPSFLHPPHLPPPFPKEPQVPQNSLESSKPNHFYPIRKSWLSQLFHSRKKECLDR